MAQLLQTASCLCANKWPLRLISPLFDATSVVLSPRCDPIERPVRPLRLDQALSTDRRGRTARDRFARLRRALPSKRNVHLVVGDCPGRLELVRRLSVLGRPGDSTKPMDGIVETNNRAAHVDQFAGIAARYVEDVRR